MSVQSGTQATDSSRGAFGKVVSVLEAPTSTDERVTDELNHFRERLTRDRREIEKHVPDGRAYINAVLRFPRGYELVPLGDAGMDLDEQRGVIRLNSTSLRQVLNCYSVDDEVRRSAAALLFAVHETFHIVQGIGRYADVPHVKQDCCTWLMSYLDLRSTTVAANLIATCNALNSKDFVRDQRDGFEFFWVDVAQQSLNAFPIYANMPKYYQYFGHLLMSAALRTNAVSWSAWTTHDTLWPQWSVDYRYLTVLSNDMRVVVAPTEVNPRLLRRITEKLSTNDVDGALADACQLLPMLRYTA